MCYLLSINVQRSSHNYRKRIYPSNNGFTLHASMSHWNVKIVVNFK